MPDNFFGAVRINTVMQTLQEKRGLPGPLLWSARIPDVPTVEGELTAYESGHVHIADLIMDDAEAGTYTTGKYNFVGYAGVNLKIGTAMTQAMIRQWRQISQAMRLTGDGGMFLNREAGLVDKIRQGVLNRKEALRIAMLTDAFTYNRLGIRITGATWGMPADLKVTVGTAWSSTGSATPIADIQAVIRIGETRYGETYNRLTMSRAALDEIVAMTEFQDKAKPFLATGIGFANLSVEATSDMTRLLERVLGRTGLTIELYDRRYWTQAADGTESSTNYHPINQVVFTNTDDDGSTETWDFGQREVIEPLVASMMGNGGNGLGLLGGQAVYGPISYATCDDEFNPPNVTYWAVDGGWPRKKRRTASAVLSVGTVVDAISTAEPPFI